MTKDGDPSEDLRAILEREQAPLRRSRLGIAAIGLGAAATLALAAAAMLTWGDGAAYRFETAEVTRGDLEVTVTATGTLQPRNRVEVGTEISGTIRTVEVDYNDRVTVGQVLAKLDTDRLEAQLREAEAAVAAAKARELSVRATLSETRLRLERCRELAKTGVCSPQDLDTAQAAYDRARAEEESVRAQQAEALAKRSVARTNLAKAVIASPIDGIVLERKIEPGQTVAASLQTPVLFTLAENLTQMELLVAVDEADIGQVAEGQPATFSVDAHPDRTFDAVISQVRFAPQTIGGVVTYETVLLVENEELLLRPGMTATAAIVVQRVRDARLVPNAALRFTPPDLAPESSRGGGLVGALLPRPPRPPSSQPPGNATSAAGGKRTVWTLRGGTTPEPIEVSTGATDGRLTEIREGDVQAGLAVLVDAVRIAR